MTIKIFYRFVICNFRFVGRRLESIEECRHIVCFYKSYYYERSLYKIILKLSICMASIFLQ